MSAPTCKNCNTELQGKYCHACGQKMYSDHDRTITHFFEDAFHFLTHFEGKFLHSLRLLLKRPGQWSLDYIEGRRQRHFKPISFFLLLVLLYLLFPVFEGLNMRLHFYEAQPLFGKWAGRKIQQAMLIRGETFDELSASFAAKSAKLSKLSLILFIPLTAAVLKLLYPRRKPFFTDYLTLSTEINNQFVLLAFLLYPLVIALLSLFVAPAYLGDNSVLGNAANIAFLLYGGSAMGRFFKAGRLEIFWKSLLFFLLYFLMVFMLYRFILFATVMWLLQ